MSTFGMAIDVRRCVNCQACLVACKAENEVPAGRSRNWVREQEAGAYPTVVVRIAPGQCMQCAEPPCVRLCPTGASFISPEGIVLVNVDDCIGCRYCSTSCPYDARYFDEESGTVDKCTFCAHRVEKGLEPACVVTCPARARTFGDLSDRGGTLARMIAARDGQPEKPEAGTRPKIFYVS
jgi:Fe-S-cluster-containing dehydrogenase component